MVVFEGEGEGASFHQSDSLEDASLFLESLKNDQGVENARLFRMEEIQFELRPYYKVELAGAGAPSAPQPSASSAPPRAPSKPAAAAPAESKPAPSGSAGGSSKPATEAPSDSSGQTPKVKEPAVAAPAIESFGSVSKTDPAPAPATPSPTPAPGGAGSAPAQPQRRGLFGR